VVLCGPLGAEADSAHRSLRELAERVAAAGLPTLRFDYLGTGDSAGDEQDAGRVDAWLQSVHGAIRFLRDHEGVEQFTLIGCRFGATLAAVCAQQLGGVEGLVLLAPIRSGHAYRRELAMMAHLDQRADDDRSSQREAHGIPLTAETLARLGEVAIRADGSRPAARALILTREGMSVDRSLVNDLTALGVEVQEGEFTGYGHLVGDQLYSQYPFEAFGRVLEWIAPGAKPRAPRAACFGEVAIPLPGVRETALEFGEAPAMFGVMCRPVEPTAENRPVLVFLNNGAATHVGADRMWVSMARQFARLGFASLRFDLSGVGDSPLRARHRQPIDHVDEAVYDVRAAIDWLESEGYSRVILIGYCRGAKLACNVALHDGRVIAQLLVAPLPYFWDGGVIYRPLRSPAGYLKLACDLSTWRVIFNGRVPRVVLSRAAGRLARSVGAALGRRIFGAPAPSEASLQAAVRLVRSLAGRAVDTLMIFGDDDPLLELLEEYFGVGRHGLDALLDVRICMMTGVGHLFPRRSDRDRLAAIMAEFLCAEPSTASSHPESNSGIAQQNPLQPAIAAVVSGIEATPSVHHVTVVDDKKIP